ncbi:L-arabinokinase-like [Silene latifolia]|uniref:L-arabinokinase-like n=1 Tax=Silene latifolia TaxID=37657 RepID=UPI003D7711B7
MIRRDLLTGNWKPYIDRAMSLKPCYTGGLNGGEVAASILQDAAVGKHNVSDKLSGARRLQDAIVLGYQLQRISCKDPDLSIPEWYASAQNELGQRCSSPKLGDDGALEDCENLYKEFKIIHGDLLNLHDTKTFLSNLAKLAKVTEKDTKHHSRDSGA